MSHGHSHDNGGSHGHSHGGHGHSHGGGAKEPRGLTEAKLNELEDDDQTVRVLREEPVGEPQTLEEACERGSLSAAVMCVARGADVTRTDSSVGATPLHWAAMRGHLPVVRFLVDMKADVNRKDERGQTPLFWAIVENRLEVADFLLTHGADPYEDDKRGCDAYSVATQHGSLAMLHLLHTHKRLDPAEEDDDKHNCLVWACYKGYLHIAEYLVAIHKMPHQGLDDNKRSALHWAAREGHVDVCVWLMSLGLDPAAVDASGMTPAQWADKHNHAECAKAIRAHLKQQPARDFGTIASVTKHWLFAASCAAAVIYVIGGYLLVTRFIPAAIAYSIMGAYGTKGMMYAGLLPTPMYNSRPQQSLDEMMNVPRNAEEAFRGPSVTNYRDPGVVLVWIGFVIAQHCAMQAAGVEPGPLYWAFALTLAIAGALAKLNSGGGVVPRNGVSDDPLLKAVERKEFEDLRWRRIYRPSHHIRVPLRAFHSKELDAVIHEYDGWSLAFDMPVARDNRRAFVVACFAFIGLQACVFFDAYGVMAQRYCKPEHEFSIAVWAWNMFVSAMPCKVPYPSDSYIHYVLPTEANHQAWWLIPLSALLGIGAFVSIWRELQAISQGVTTLELVHRTMPSTDGGLTPIFRSGHSVFSNGSVLRNFIAFFTGADGKSWREATAIPPPQAVGGSGGAKKR